MPEMKCQEVMEPKCHTEMENECGTEFGEECETGHREECKIRYRVSNILYVQEVLTHLINKLLHTIFRSKLRLTSVLHNGFILDKTFWLLSIYCIFVVSYLRLE